MIYVIGDNLPMATRFADIDLGLTFPDEVKLFGLTRAAEQLQGVRIGLEDLVYLVGNKTESSLRLRGLLLSRRDGPGGYTVVDDPGIGSGGFSKWTPKEEHVEPKRSQKVKPGVLDGATPIYIPTDEDVAALEDRDLGDDWRDDSLDFNNADALHPTASGAIKTAGLLTNISLRYAEQMAEEADGVARIFERLAPPKLKLATPGNNPELFDHPVSFYMRGHEDAPWELHDAFDEWSMYGELFEPDAPYDVGSWLKHLAPGTVSFSGHSYLDPGFAPAAGSWSDPSSDPVGDIKRMMDHMERNTGVRPNVLAHQNVYLDPEAERYMRLMGLEPTMQHMTHSPVGAPEPTCEATEDNHAKNSADSSPKIRMGDAKVWIGKPGISDHVVDMRIIYEDEIRLQATARTTSFRRLQA